MYAYRPILLLSISLSLSLSRRHRLSEADEDEELLEAEDDDLESDTITMFTDSPYCKFTPLSMQTKSTVVILFMQIVV